MPPMRSRDGRPLPDLLLVRHQGRPEPLPLRGSKSGPGRNCYHIKVGDTKGLSPSHPYNEMTMADTRHYTDAALRQMISDLSEGQKTMLRVGGALPKEPLGNLHIDLRGSDVARMIEMLQEEA